jgi:hypothetical protein
MSSGAIGNHKLSIDTTQDPCYFSLDSTFKFKKYNFIICSVKDFDLNFVSGRFFSTVQYLSDALISAFCSRDDNASLKNLRYRLHAFEH